MCAIWRHHQAKKAEEALKNSEDRLNTILDNVGAAIFIKNTKYRYTYVNRKVCEVFGRSAEDILGKSDNEFFSPGSVDEIMLSDRPVIESGETVTREETNSRFDKAPRTYWTVNLPLRDSMGTVMVFVAFPPTLPNSSRRRAKGRLLRRSRRCGVAITDDKDGLFYK
jgi:polar amino acid transport system substrate-binding protein